MTDVLFAPSLIFMTPETWEAEHLRDAALQQFLDYLEAVIELRMVTILWSLDLEELLWIDPPLPPWRIDRDWKLKLVPVIARKFRQTVNILDIANDCPGTGFIPKNAIPAVREDVTSAFQILIHEAGSKSATEVLCVDESCKAPAIVPFKCESHALNFELRLIRSANLLTNDPHISEMFWTSLKIDGPEDLHSVLRMVLRASQDVDNVLYTVSYSEAFIKDISNASNKRTVLAAIASRVCKTENEAGHDHSLCDESVKGKKGLRRFRVSGVERIHYAYPQKSGIKLMRFYPDGHHDDGL